MGLPGSGKTTLANELAPLLNAKRLNADEVRKEANDWDFSAEGRKRQAKRMADFAIKLKEEGNYVVAETVKKNIEDRLNPEFEGHFKIMMVPNITNICYGRGVGYKIEEIELSKEIQEISATKIRAKMREEGKLK